MYDRLHFSCRPLRGRGWMYLNTLPEKSNMAMTESDPEPKVRKMSITFK